MWSRSPSLQRDRDDQPVNLVQSVEEPLMHEPVDTVDAQREDEEEQKEQSGASGDGMNTVEAVDSEEATKEEETTSDIPVITLDLVDDETPDLPEENIFERPQSEKSQSVQPRICDLRERSMSQDVAVSRSLEDEIKPFVHGKDESFTERVDGFWKD